MDYKKEYQVKCVCGKKNVLAIKQGTNNNKYTMKYMCTEQNVLVY